VTKTLRPPLAVEGFSQAHAPSLPYNKNSNQLSIALDKREAVILIQANTPTRAAVTARELPNFEELDITKSARINALK
jgi:hypothetical protein